MSKKEIVLEWDHDTLSSSDKKEGQEEIDHSKEEEDDHDHDHDDHLDHHDDHLDLGRIGLQPFDFLDLEDYLAWSRDGKIYQFSNLEPTMSKEHGMELLKAMILDHPWCKSICVDQKSIGAISVTPNPAPTATHRAEIGYMLGSAYWGKGIATHAVKLVTKAIFYEWLHLERLEAIVDVENMASQRVLEKAGFAKEGLLRKYYVLKGMPRDMLMYSFLSSDSQG